MGIVTRAAGDDMVFYNSRALVRNAVGKGEIVMCRDLFNGIGLIMVGLITIASGAGTLDRQEIRIPDIQGYHTLKCDLHMHTVFSDGQIWPTWRVEEAWRDGLDAIALTDHIEYQPRKEDVLPRLQRPFEIAKGTGMERDIIIIRGAEITKSVPPGHFNAIFLSDVTALETNDLAIQLERAKEQDAFVFWNHPGWRVKTNESILLPVHEEAVAKKLVQGMEIYNGVDAYTNVWPWALQNRLTLLADSDTHVPIESPKANHADHRTMTLVFAKERSVGGIKEALRAGRTAVWAGEIIAGSEEWLRALFSASVRVEPPHHRTPRQAWIKVRNTSDFVFRLVGCSGPGPEKVSLPAGKVVLLKLAVSEKKPVPEMEYTVENMLTGPATPLHVVLK